MAATGIVGIRCNAKRMRIIGKIRYPQQSPGQEPGLKKNPLIGDFLTPTNPTLNTLSSTMRIIPQRFRMRKI